MVNFLIYLSKANTYISTREINKILLNAKEFNARHNITGILLFHNGSFLQVLEGKEASLDKLYAKIKKDPRHTCDQYPLVGQVEERIFGAWSMGFSQIDDVSKESKVAWLAQHIKSISNGHNQPEAADILSFLQSLLPK